MSRHTGMILAMVALLAGATATSADAKARRHHPAAKVAIVSWPAPADGQGCTIEIYPYAPSVCLPGGFILFDERAYFAPRYGYRAQRYIDGW